jgi:hypothetical protein
MAKPIEDEQLGPKLERWRNRWSSADNDAKKKNLDVAAEKKGRKSKILEEVERAGIPLDAFKAEMRMLDHADKAKGVRADVVEADDKLVLEAFDRLTVLAETPLPLFDTATKAEIKANAKKRPPEDKDDIDDTAEAEDDGKVVAFGTTKEDKTAAASAG